MFPPLENEGLGMLAVFLAFGLPMLVWSAGENWAKDSEFKSFLLLLGAAVAFAVGLIIFGQIYEFIES